MGLVAVIGESTTYWAALREVAISASAPSADLITAYVGIATAAGTAIWVVTKSLTERKEARDQADAQATGQLQQRRDEELRTRRQLAAGAHQAVGDATNPAARRWTMSALSLYPAETLNLLLNSLSEAGPEDSAAIMLAIISIGADALPSTIRAHKIARQMCGTVQLTADPIDPAVGLQGVEPAGASQVRDCTRDIIVNLLLQLTDSERACGRCGG